MTIRIHSQKPASATPLRSSTPSQVKQLLMEAAQSDQESTQEEVAVPTNGYNFANIRVNVNKPDLEIDDQERLGVVQAKIDNFRALGKKRTSEFNYNLTSKVHQENKTGMPNNLKGAIEALSGMSMDDVQVHYNSSKPLHLQALAYTQGTNIYIASGQEKYLPHEAWHVVQQKQGRVKPTLQMKNTKINDDVGLEKEADQMGARAMNTEATSLAEQPGRERTGGQDTASVSNNETIQLTTELGNFVKDQIELQKAVLKNPEDFEKSLTTVGFEHEFAQMASGPLRGVTHLEIAKSKQTMPYTGLPFVLETDAVNALELVSPPFLIQTIENKPIPDPEKVEEVDNLFKNRLVELVKPNPTLGELVKNFRNEDGIIFPLKWTAVNRGNMTPNTPWNVSWWTRPISKKVVKSIKLEPSKKGAPTNDNFHISTHVNFASDAETFDFMGQINEQTNIGVNDKYTKALSEIENYLKREMYRLSLQEEIKSSGGGINTVKDKINKAKDKITAVLTQVKIVINLSHKLSSQTQNPEEKSDLINLNWLINGTEEIINKNFNLVDKELDKPLIGRYQKSILIKNFDKIISSLEEIYINLRHEYNINFILFKESQIAISETIKALNEFPVAAESTLNLSLFLNAMARTLSGQLVVPSLQVLKTTQKKKYFLGKPFKFKKEYEQMITSIVKDVKGVWIKDTLMNIGIGLLKPNEWNKVKKLVNNQEFKQNIKKFQLPSDIKDVLNRNKIPTDSFYEAVLSALNQINTAIDANKLTNEATDNSNRYIGPKIQPNLFSHNPQWIGVRQDTYIPAEKVQMSEIWPNRRLHVVESRVGTVETMKKIKELNEQKLSKNKLQLTDNLKKTDHKAKTPKNQNKDQIQSSMGLFLALQKNQIGLAQLKNLALGKGIRELSIWTGDENDVEAAKEYIKNNPWVKSYLSPSDLKKALGR